MALTDMAAECDRAAQHARRCGSQHCEDTGIGPCRGQDDTTGHGHDIEQDQAFRNEGDNGFPLAFDQGFA